MLVGKFSLKHQVNWNTVSGEIQDLLWHNIFLADNPVEVLNEHLSQLVGCYVSTNVIRVCNKDKPWFYDECRRYLVSSRRLIFGGPVIILGLTLKNLSTVK